jgi:hypothetical protein
VDDFVAAFPALSAAAYGVAYRLLGDREEARDVAQEALVRAYVRWRRVSQLLTPRVGGKGEWEPGNRLLASAFEASATYRTTDSRGLICG